MWKNIVERCMAKMTVWRMRISCWIPKATNTHPGCVIIIVLPLQQWLYGSASMLLCMFTAFLVRIVIVVFYLCQKKKVEVIGQVRQGNEHSCWQTLLSCKRIGCSFHQKSEDKFLYNLCPPSSKRWKGTVCVGGIWSTEFVAGQRCCVEGEDLVVVQIVQSLEVRWRTFAGRINTILKTMGSGWAFTTWRQY